MTQLSMLLGVSFFAVQTALVVLLLVHRARCARDLLALRESEARWRAIAETRPVIADRYAAATAAGGVGVWEWNFETNEIYVDPNLEAILGFASGEMTQHPEDWASRVHPDDLPTVTARIQECIARDEEYQVEHRMVHRDGSTRWFLSRGTVARRADRTVYRMVGTKVDITQRKQAEIAIGENQAILQAANQKLQELAGRLIAAQEIERGRIARELHDDVSQQVAGLSIALSAVKRRVAELPGTRDLYADVSALRERTIMLAEAIRNVSHELHPSVLQHAGLVEALTAYCADLQRREPLTVVFTADGDFAPTSNDLALCLYRVAQEALRNVVTHAHARRADIHLRRSGDVTELTIADDGIGFDIDEARSSLKGLGLISISERVRLAGGAVSIITEVNKGTRLRVAVPVSQGAPGARALSVPA